MDGEAESKANYAIAAGAGMVAGAVAIGFGPTGSESILKSLGYTVTYTEACGALGCWSNGTLIASTEHPRVGMPIAETAYDSSWGSMIFGSILGAYLITRKLQKTFAPPTVQLGHSTLEDRLAKVNIGHPQIERYEFERTG